jgi:hypothetical protein
VNQVQLRPGVGTEANNVAGVGRDFRLEQDKMQQRDINMLEHLLCFHVGRWLP